MKAAQGQRWLIPKTGFALALGVLYVVMIAVLESHVMANNKDGSILQPQVRTGSSVLPGSVKAVKASGGGGEEGGYIHLVGSFAGGLTFQMSCLEPSGMQAVSDSSHLPSIRGRSKTVCPFSMLPST